MGPLNLPMKPPKQEDPRPAPPPEGADVRAMMRYNSDMEDWRKRQALRTGQVPPAPTPVTNEVHEILNANLEQEKNLRLNAGQPIPKRPHKRRRDFWTIVILGDIPLLGALLLGLRLYPSPLGIILSVVSFAAIIILTAGTYWVMYHVMEDY